MTLPTSAPITLQQIYAEFGAPAGTALTALVRGGAYVPDIPANAGVPTAPPLSLLDFLGAEKTPPVQLGEYSCSAGDMVPDAYAYAFVSIQSNGTVTKGSSSLATTVIDTWLLAGATADYELYATLTGDSTSSGIYNQWLPMSTSREFLLQDSGNLQRTKSSTINLTVRPVGGGANIDTGSIALSTTLWL